MTTFRKALTVLTGGIWDGVNRVYSDSNPPETLLRTLFPAGSVPNPAAGLATEYTPDGKTLYLRDSAGVVTQIGAIVEAVPFSQAGALTVKTGTTRFPIKGGTFTILSVAAMVGTAPTGAAVILDVKKNGTTIFGTSANRPTIAVSTNAATVGAHSVTSVTDGDYLTVDIAQVGSTVAGSDLTLVIRLQR